MRHNTPPEGFDELPSVMSVWSPVSCIIFVQHCATILYDLLHCVLASKNVYTNRVLIASHRSGGGVKQELSGTGEGVGLTRKQCKL